jgi:hypothetical protein
MKIELVKYVSLDEKYTNLGLRLENGYVMPIKAIVGKHYYQLRDLAKLVVLKGKE